MVAWADGNTTLQIPESLNEFVRILVDEGYAKSNMHVVELAIALGLRMDRRAEPQGGMHDAAKVGQMDPDGILGAAIQEKYGDLEERERVNRVQEHASAGLQLLMKRFQQNDGSLDVEKLLEQTRST